MNSTFIPRPKLNLARVAARYAARREAVAKESFNDAEAQQELLQIISATSETRERANEAVGAFDSEENNARDMLNSNLRRT